MANKELRSVFGSAENVSPEVMIGGVKGSTVVWNQLIDGQYKSTTFMPDSSDTRYYFGDTVRIYTGNVYLVKCNQKTTLTSVTRNTFAYGVSSFENTSENYNLTAGVRLWLFKAQESGTLRLWCAGPNVQTEFDDFQCFDLTKLFGSDSNICAALGVDITNSSNWNTAAANFQKLFPASYYPYNAGMLLSTYGSVKLNQQFDLDVTLDRYSSQSCIFTQTKQENTKIITATTAGYFSVSTAISPAIPTGHKAFLTGQVKMPYGSNIRTVVGRNSSINTTAVTANTYTDLSSIFNVNNGGNDYSLIYFDTTTSLSVGDICYLKNIQVVDLTEMFGAGNEPATVDEFRKLFPDDYYEYNPTGTWVPVGNSGLSSTGFNLWDGTGTIDSAIKYQTGEVTPFTDFIATDFISVLPSTSYYQNQPYAGSGVLGMAFYDGNKNFISGMRNGGGESNWPSVFETPNNCHYLRISVRNTEASTFTLNLSDPSRNGTYEPYWKGYYSLDFIQSIKTPDGEKLFPNGLLSAGDVYDEITPTYAIKRVGAVDLGSLTWHYSNTYSGFFYSREQIPNLPTRTYNGICAFYNNVVVIDNSTPDKSITINSASTWGDGTGVYFTDFSYNNNSLNNGHASWLEGIMLYYELETPQKVYFQNTLFNKWRGNTIEWNQLVNFNMLKGTQTKDGITYTYNGDGTYTTTGSTSSNHLSEVAAFREPIVLVNGHKYLFRGCPKGGDINSYRFNIWHTNSTIMLAQDTGNGVIFEFNLQQHTNISPWMTFGPQTTSPKEKWIPQLHDLTLMFGPGNEPTTVTEFEELFSSRQYPYVAGSALTVTEDGYMVPGFNQWDEEWEVGGYDEFTGQKMNTTNEIRNNNFINVLPNTSYYFLKPSNFEAYRYFFYDENKTFLSSNSSSSSSVLTTSLNCYYINFHYYGSETYNNNISINISDTSKNGTYEPYSLTTVSIPQLPAFRFHADPDGVISNVTAESWSDITKENIVKSLKDPSTGEQLFPYGLLTAGSVSDEVTPTYAVKRVGVVDLAALSWAHYGNAAFLSNVLNNANIAVSHGVKPNIYCSKYTTVKASANTSDFIEQGDNIISTNTENKLFLRDTANASILTSALKEVYCYYQLTSPITVNFSENLQDNALPLLSAPLNAILQTLNI